MQLNFNAYDYDPTQGQGICLPLADYPVEITAAEPKAVNGKPNEGLLELSLTVISGELRGVVQKHRLNLFNSNEVAKRIAHSELSAIAIAIGRPHLQESSQLVGGQFLATIGPQADNEKYSEVKMIKCKDGSLPVRPVQGAATAPPPPAAAAPPAPAAAGWPAASPAATAPPAAPAWGNQPAAAAAPPATGGQAVPPWAK